MTESDPSHVELLPSLPLEAWQDTCTSLHMRVQIVGKIRLALSPMLNHWWQTTLYLTPRGLTTSSMPFRNEAIQIDFDFIDHNMLIQTSQDARRTIPLIPQPVADFYRALMEELRSLDVEVEVWPVPVEVDERIPFDQDDTHVAYDPEYAWRFWRILLQVDRVMKVFRSRFCGKVSPVHFFFGSFDLNTTRFSGRTAPLMQNARNVALSVMQEAYVDEVSSCGFWPGSGLGEPAFYAYTYPEPPGYAQYPIQPAEAHYHTGLKEFILPYEAVRTSGAWEENLLAFFQTTYEAGANLASWDRAALEQSFLIHPQPP